METSAQERFRHVVQPRLGEGYRLARWLTGNAADAEDVLQEACLRAYRALEGYADGSARAWFLTIVRHTCYSWLERHRSSMDVSSEDVSPADLAAFERGGPAAGAPATPEGELIAKDEAGHVARAIEALPPPLRETLILREYHDLSYREIAAVSGVPIGTVMSRLSRARQHLVVMLDAASR